MNNYLDWTRRWSKRNHLKSVEKRIFVRFNCQTVLPRFVRLMYIEPKGLEKNKWAGLDRIIAKWQKLKVKLFCIHVFLRKTTRDTELLRDRRLWELKYKLGSIVGWETAII